MLTIEAGFGRRQAGLIDQELELRTRDLVVLAIQYGHMRTVLDGRTASGYGNRARRGFHGELDVSALRPPGNC
ncbi:hypothetical protein [Nocardia sp. NPDC004711]